MKRLVGDLPWTHLARLWSGLVLFAFVVTHFLNHAIGIFGIPAMEFAQEWRIAIWKSLPGSLLLYGAMAIHISFATARVVGRQTWRIPWDELWQIISGLALPFLLMGHVIETRIAGSYFGVDESYGQVLFRLWPSNAAWQSVALIVAWTHGITGIHHALRSREWYQRWRNVALTLAVVVPCTALAGFVAAGREAHMIVAEKVRNPAQEAGIAQAANLIQSGVAVFVVLTLGFIAFSLLKRRRAHALTITYRGYGPVSAPFGTSILEASRMHSIPHPALCRGRARCSSCLVHILSDPATLPEPFVSEKAALLRIGLPANVRLGCQLRPTQDVSLRILMPMLEPGSKTLDNSGERQDWGLERQGTVVALDLRSFTALTRSRLPYELAILVNRFSSEMTHVVEGHRGRVDQMFGDGLVAVFDQDDAGRNARNALHSVRDMVRIMDVLNKQLTGALPIPIRAGIGVHSGRIILVRVDDGIHATAPLALGDTLSIANGLQLASKELLADCIISKETADASGLEFRSHDMQSIMIDGYDEPMDVYAISDRAALQKLVPKSTVQKAADALGITT